MATEKLHATFSASGASKWLNCPGSIELCKSAPPQAESKWAEEGTEAHTCLETFLKNPQKKATSIRKMLEKAHPKDMVEHALGAATELWNRVPEGAELLTETKVSLEFVAPDMFGTVDSAIVEEFGRLQVWDFKYGAGIPVDVEDNPQLIYYALGLAHKYDFNFTDVEIGVIQPRAEHHSGEYTRSVIISVDELRAWEKIFRDGVLMAEDPLADLVAGDWCRFCAAKAICPAVGDLAFQQARLDFAPVEMLTGAPAVALPALPTPEALPNLGHVLAAGDKIEKWLEGVRQHAQHVLETGGEVEGYKLVAKRAQRAWKEDVTDEALVEFGDGVMKDPEILSPAQFEKKFKDKVWVEERTTRESSGVTMVPIDDKRPAVSLIAKDFGDTIDTTATEVLPDIFSRATTKTTKRKAKPAPKAKPKPKVKPKAKLKPKPKAKPKKARR